MKYDVFQLILHWPQCFWSDVHCASHNLFSSDEIPRVRFDVLRQYKVYRYCNKSTRTSLYEQDLVSQIAVPVDNKQPEIIPVSLGKPRNMTENISSVRVTCDANTCCCKDDLVHFKISALVHPKYPLLRGHFVSFLWCGETTGSWIRCWMRTLLACFQELWNLCEKCIWQRRTLLSWFK